MAAARGRWSRQDADPTVTAMVVAASADVTVDGRPDALFAVGSHPSRGSGTMSRMTSTGEVGSGFDIVLRGYERKQVDEHLARATADRRAAAGRIGALERRVEELQVELQNAQADLSWKRIKRRPILGGLINEYERAV
jgi:hypothetical protein